VTLLGIPAGEVTDVGLQFDRNTAELRPRVEIVFFAERIVARLSAGEQAAGEVLAKQAAGERVELINVSSRSAGGAANCARAAS
jgi:hypothetical protein